MKFDVIVLPIIEWDHRFQRPQHIASAFAADGHRVFYARLTFLGEGAGWSAEQVRENLWQVALPGPVDHNRFLQPLSDDTIAGCVDALLDLARERDVDEAIILVQQPFWTKVALQLAAKTRWKIVYDCMDEHNGLTVLNDEILVEEATLGRCADLVVSTSRNLAAKHEAAARRHVLLPNACEYEHFADPGDAPDPLPGITGPIIGYYGAVMEWFDVDMVRQAASLRPDWTFVVIGAIDIDIEPLRTLPNVQLLGEKPYAELPAYLHRFDVAIIPFRLIPIIQATNPVKFYEYLSAGKPVVASALPELEPYPDLHDVAHDGTELVAQAARAMAEDTPEKARHRREWASKQTWRSRYEVLRREIDALWDKVSVVIVSYQNLDRIRDCVESIARHTDYPDYEVVIVDNASSPDVVEFLRGFCATHARFKLIESDENLGFAKGNNVGLAAIADDSRHVVLLNNDTVVTAGWLQGLIRWLADPTIGLVGPVTWPNGSANEAAVPVPYADMEGMHAFAAERAREYRGRSFDLPMLAFYCVAVRRDVLAQVGPLDEAYGIGMFEDDDYAMRIRQAGLRVVCAQDVFIHHVGRASFGKLQEQAYSSLFQENRAYYERKWGVAWRMPAVRPDIAGILAAADGATREVPVVEPKPVSVVLVNYNGLVHLDPCLRSLAALNYPPHLLEIVLVDNASHDGSVAWLKTNWPRVVVVENAENVGFSRACNQGARIANGEFVAFLNNDMRVDPEWLNGLLATLAKDEAIACAGSMVMNWEGTAVEYAGRFDDVFSIAYEPLPHTLEPRYAADAYSLFVSGGAMLLDRRTFLEVGGFDSRYFMYHEDVDLCWRLWVRGKRCCLSPQSLVYHRGGASSRKLQSEVVQAWGQKHLLWTAIKNFDDRNLRHALPLLIYFLVERGRWSETGMRALGAAFEETQAALSSILSDRLAIQRSRAASDEAIFNTVGHPLAFMLRAPLLGEMVRELDKRQSWDQVDFANPQQVARAMLDCLGASVSLRAEYAPLWQADAVEKYRRVTGFALRPDAATPIANPPTTVAGPTIPPAAAGGPASLRTAVGALVRRLRNRATK